MESIVIQCQEDHPHNPGWWRYSRPVHRMVAKLPEFSESSRWSFGSAEDAARAQAAWDDANPRG